MRYKTNDYSVPVAYGQQDVLGSGPRSALLFSVSVANGESVPALCRSIGDCRLHLAADLPQSHTDRLVAVKRGEQATEGASSNGHSKVDIRTSAEAVRGGRIDVLDELSARCAVNATWCRSHPKGKILAPRGRLGQGAAYPQRGSAIAGTEADLGRSGRFPKRLASH
ncbi:hypothetical protein DPM13_17835 [Paracoccus mutanolyticus]|uniref:Uncharacterized protein n=1 Tax=Paracoccus mutanolyticus TaxID=1499308 RepID=A0ABN5ME85_9RHOB|nr:hypothetical protein DPM13_17835 [Paracoccus mutanolyticus]